MNKDIKWCCLQPLTGGFYFGAENAVGHPAEFIISYPGFDAAKFNKDGVLVDAGNEYNLIEYLKKHNRMVPYYQFDRKPFETSMDEEVTLLKEGVKTEAPDYSNIDLVVAVPVCSGLSSATRGASAETLESRNCNMVFLARYALGTIKPKVYIFENAPQLMSVTGAKVREKLESIASEFDYNIGYYKTDTQYHDNCQRRPRTFVYFFKKDSAHAGVPKLGFEQKHISAKELLDRIPKNDNDPMQVSLPMTYCNEAIFAFVKKLYGENWRANTKSPTLLCDIIDNNQLDDLIEYVRNDTAGDEKKRESMIKGIEHIKYKLSLDKGFYTVSPTVMRNDTMPAAMFKTIPACLHYKDDRLYTIREWLTTMGMPYDFNMYGDLTKVFAKIGQNVPARTAQFITSEAINVINNWDSCERVADDTVLFNNIKHVITPM